MFMTNDSEKMDQEKLIDALLVVATTVPHILFSGFVIQQLWGWFVVPLGVAPVGVMQAAGLSLIVFLFKKKPEMNGSYPGATQTFDSVMRLLFAWSFGAIYAHFMH